MINPYYFIDENLKIGFKINLQNHNNNHAFSILSIKPIYRDFEIETGYFNKNLKEMASNYTGIIKINFNYHTSFQLLFIR